MWRLSRAKEHSEYVRPEEDTQGRTGKITQDNGLKTNAPKGSPARKGAK